MMRAWSRGLRYEDDGPLADILGYADNLELSDALKTDNAIMVQSLLDGGISPDSYLLYNGYNRPLLSIAVQFKSLNVVRLLCQRGCNLEAEDKSDNSKQPLHWAIEWSHQEVALCLLEEFGADPSSCNRMGRNAFHCCAIYKEKEILMACIRTGKTRGIDQLDRGGTNSYPSEGGCTPLMYLFFGLTPECDALVEMILGTGLVDFSKRSIKGDSPLEVACRSEFLQPKPVKTLLKYMRAKLGPDGMRAELQRKDRNGENIMTMAIQANPYILYLDVNKFDTKMAHVMRYLIKEGADHERCGNSGIFPILAATEKGLLKTAAVLIDSGCFMRVMNYRYLCPLGMACFSGNVDLVELVMEATSFHRTQPCCKKYLLGNRRVDHREIKEEIKQMVRQHSSFTPFSLQRLSRNVLRSWIGGSWRDKVAPRLAPGLSRAVYPKLYQCWDAIEENQA